ncbi:MAG: zinc ribbon domain-containing protein [Candidatus Hermodarchaeota archaeon]
MSENYPNLHSISNKRFNEILYEGFRLFGKNLILILPLGLLYIIGLIITDLLIVDFDWQFLTLTPTIDTILSKDPLTITYDEFMLVGRYLTSGFLSVFLGVLIPNIFSVLAFCLVSNYLYDKFVGRAIKLFPELKRSLNKRILMVILLLGVVFSAGWMVLIPGIIIFGFFILYIFTYHSNDSNHQLKDAKSLAKGEFWKIIGILFVNNLVILVCEMGYQMILNLTPLQSNISWYDPSTRKYGLIILFDLVINLVRVFFTPLLICLLTPLYAHLKERKEQYLQYQTLYQEASQEYETPQKDKISRPGIYCPFCGKYMRLKFQFCMHCGQNLDFEVQN